MSFVFSYHYCACLILIYGHSWHSLILLLAIVTVFTLMFGLLRVPTAAANGLYGQPTCFCHIQLLAASTEPVVLTNVTVSYLQ